MLPTFNIPATGFADRDLRSQLTQRELEILELVAQGRANSEIAHTLFISTNTVKTHLRKIYGKLGVDNRVKSAIFALRTGTI